MSISMTVPAIGNPAISVVLAGMRDDRFHDHGLQHSHEWARERPTGGLPGLVAGNTAAWPTPSTVMHDDVLYGAD